MNKILIIFGTRPELIKIAPLIHEFEKRQLRGQVILVHTNQHDVTLKQTLLDFNIQVDYHIDLRRTGNNLNQLVGKILLELNSLLSELIENDICIESILAQGDTATTYCSALLAFHSTIPFYHVEAGLRTQNINGPYPEEFYRRSIAAIAAMNFVPTQVEYQNLIREWVDPKKIIITGNTVIDTLKRHFTQKQIHPKKQVLITLHRRESDIKNRALYISYFKKLAIKNPTWKFLWLKHPGHELEKRDTNNLGNITLLEPVSYFKLLRLYEQTSIVYTDSGGIQEETAYLGIPCVVARTETERQQGINEGISSYINFESFDIDDTIALMDRTKLIFKNELYGKGNSSELIVNSMVR